MSIDSDTGEIVITDEAEPGKYNIIINITDKDALNPKTVQIETMVIVTDPDEDTRGTDTQKEDEDSLFGWPMILLIIIIIVSLVTVLLIFLMMRKAKK